MVVDIFWVVVGGSIFILGSFGVVVGLFALVVCGRRFVFDGRG